MTGRGSAEKRATRPARGKSALWLVRGVEPRFTVPVDVIREHSILPGHAVNFHVFELSDEQMTISTKADGGGESRSQIKEARDLISQANKILEEIADE